MGYRPKNKRYILDFTGTEHEGLEVTLRGLNTGQMLDLDTAMTEGSKESIGRVLALMADRLVTWNLEDEDEQPVPTTLEGILAQDLDLNLAIVNAWKTAVAGVSDPLEPSSTSGEPSLVASIPMESLSLPQPNTAVPA